MFRQFLSFFQSSVPASAIRDRAAIKTLYRHWRVRAFLGAYFGYAAYYLVRHSLDPISHVFKAAAHLTDAQFGLLISVSLMAYGIGRFTSGILVDKGNIRNLFAAGLFISSVIDLFFGYLTSFIAILFFWTLCQFAQTIGSASCTRVFVYWFSPRERARVWLFWDSSKTLGILLAAVLAGTGLQLTEIFSWVSWRWIFIVAGLWGIGVSVWLFCFMPDTPRSVGLPPVEEYTRTRYLLRNQQGKEQSYWKILRKYVLTNKYIWILCLANLCAYFGQYVVISWAALFLDSRHLPTASIPLIFTLNPLIGAVGAISAGAIASRFFNGRCLRLGMSYFICFAVATYFFFQYAGPANIRLTCFFIGLIGFFGAAISGLLAVAVSFLTVKESVAAANGMYGLIGYVGACLAGSGASWVKASFGWGGVFSVCILVSMLGALLVLAVSHKE